MTKRQAPPTYGRKIDTNHAVIRDGLRAAGYPTLDYSMVGHGIFDLLTVIKCGASVWVEVKTEGEKLTKAEKLFWDTYTGLKIIAYDLEDALDKLEAIDARYR